MGLFYITELKPYGFRLMVSAGQTRKELDAELAAIDAQHRTKFMPRLSDMIEQKAKATGAGGMVMNIGTDLDPRADGLAAVMWLHWAPTTIARRAIAVHELLHVVAQCLVPRGMKLNARSGNAEEPYCYLLDGLYEELFRKMKEKRTKKPPR